MRFYGDGNLIKVAGLGGYWKSARMGKLDLTGAPGLPAVGDANDLASIAHVHLICICALRKGVV